MPDQSQTLSLLIKPAGHACNLACDYCFYRRVEDVYPDVRPMDQATAEAVISRALAKGRTHNVFTWQGGEPTMMGLDFFKRVVDLQRRLAAPGQQVINTLQTNGLLINEAWCRFLRDENWLVGLSLDGPAEIHDVYRRAVSGQGSHAQAMRAAELMGRLGVEFNILAMLTDQSVGRPDEVYRFFRRHGFDYLQFIPCFEWTGGRPARYSVNGQETGQFFSRLFDLWMADGFPEVSIRLFEDILIFFFDRVRVSCCWMERCDSYLVVEHNGDCYPCDFFVEPDWRLGNLVTDDLNQILKSPRRDEFAARKSTPPDECRDCILLNFCQGDCPRYRRGPGGDDTRVSEFCVTLKMLVHHMEPSLPRIMDEVRRVRDDRPS